MWSTSLDLQEDPLVPRNLLVPEALADPETNSKTTAFSDKLIIFETVTCYRAKKDPR